MKTFDPTKPVRTRGGKRARIICTDREGSEPIVAIVGEYGGSLRTYYETGQYTIYGNHEFDLLNVEPEIAVHIWRGLNGGLHATEDLSTGAIKRLTDEGRYVKSIMIDPN